VMKNPDYEKASGDPKHAARLVPIYPETEKLTSRWLRPKIQSLLRYADELEEFMPGELLARRGFLSRAAAVRQVHFPESAQALERARERLAFEEMFVLQLAAQLAKRLRRLRIGPQPLAADRYLLGRDDGARPCRDRADDQAGRSGDPPPPGHLTSRYGPTPRDAASSCALVTSE